MLLGPLTNAAFGSGRKYHKYKFPSRKFCSVHLPTRIYYLETCRFQQYDDNSDFVTLTFVMVAAADKLFRLTTILRKKMAKHCKRLQDALSSM